MPEYSNNPNHWGGTTWTAIAVLSILWWVIIGQGSLQRSVLLACLSFASFIAGSLVGFLFSSYGEEVDTLGKIRDWLIGAITALTVVKTDSLKAVLIVFAGGSEGTEFAYALGNAVLYAGLGFYFMYFSRKIIFNLWLAQSTVERAKVEGSQEAGHVVQSFLVRLPASVLTGIEDIEEIEDVSETEAQRLKALLYSEDVDSFLKEADEAVKKGTLDWDVVSKTAYIQYYRTYFEKENKPAAVAKASEWITRALIMNPLHSDLTVLYAEMLDANDEKLAACTVLERLALRNDAPMFVLQWLGYYMRFLPEKLDDAIRYSERYHGLFPDETDTFFNIGYAYARKYCLELESCRQAAILTSENRQKALSALRVGLQYQPEMKEKIRSEWIKQGAGLECMAGDADFLRLVGSSNNSPAVKDGNNPKGSGE